MTTPAISSLDAAVVAQLAQDPDVLAFVGPAPGGVYFDVAPEGADRYVVVVLENYSVLRAMPGGVVVLETCTYAIRAWAQDVSAQAVEAAALAIRRALERDDYPITGYTLKRSQHVDYLRKNAVDDTTGRTWQNFGGRYDVQAAPLA
jgi:hypothetical protein